jgi:hypothetical protein
MDRRLDDGGDGLAATLSLAPEFVEAVAVDVAGRPGEFTGHGYLQKQTDLRW